MPMTDQELKFALDNEEPRYPEIAARLDESDIPRLRAFAEGGDVALATKAIYLASLIESDDADDIVARAAQSGNELVRIASATALPNLAPPARERVAGELIEDSNPAVSKLVLRAVDPASPSLMAKVRALETGSAHEELRSLARQKRRDGD
jgi:hypothetical protein